jgi:hypothetical protein
MTLMLCSGCSVGEFGVLVVDLVMFTRRGRPREEDVNHPVVMVAQRPLAGPTFSPVNLAITTAGGQ